MYRSITHNPESESYKWRSGVDFDEDCRRVDFTIHYLFGEKY